MPTIFAGIPSISDAPFITSPYQSMRTLGLGDIFKKNNYSTSFFHGGHNGTMYFDTMASRFGFDRYYGMDEYPNNDHYDGKWGIFDHHFLKFCIEKITKQKKPFFNAIFTLSSHHPYTIPVGFQGKFPKGSLEIHESIGYTDRALELFFEEAKKQNWYKNTMFIITADHTQKPSQKKFGRKISDYRVPLIFFHPNRTIKGVDTNMVTSQSAIGSSLIDLLDFDSQWTFLDPLYSAQTKKMPLLFCVKVRIFTLSKTSFFTLLTKIILLKPRPHLGTNLQRISELTSKIQKSF